MGYPLREGLIPEAFDYNTNTLVDRWSHYDDETARSVPYRATYLQVQKKSQIFDWFDTISIFCLLSVFKLACNTNRVHKGAALWLV